MSAFCCLKPAAETDANVVNQAKSKKQKDIAKSVHDLIDQNHNTYTGSQLLD